MFPKRLRQDPRILGLTLVITFISGANFFSILMFWPTQVTTSIQLYEFEHTRADNDKGFQRVWP